MRTRREDISSTVLKDSDVVRQTKTDIDHVSERTINDIVTEDKNISLSKEWNRTMRIQILRTRRPEGYKWVEGRPTKVPQVDPPRQHLAGSMDEAVQETERKLQIGKKSMPNCKHKDHLKVIANARLTLENDAIIPVNECFVLSSVS